MSSAAEAATAAEPGIHLPVDVHSAAAEQAHDIAVARKDILRIATAWLVDDGKSTLIGGPLFDSKAVFEDQRRRRLAAKPAGYLPPTSPTLRCHLHPRPPAEHLGDR
jgi:hypothetical protein